MNIAGIGQQVGPAVTIVIGIASAVGVLAAMLAMSVGARRDAMADVRPDRVILTSVGSQSVNDSSIPREAASALRELPGIRRNAKGQPIAILEAEVIIEARRREGGARIQFPLYGDSSGLTDLRPELHVTSGRMFRTGLNELIASNLCAREYSGFDIGDRRTLRGGDWTVVGHFDQGPAMICTLYTDAGSILAAFGRDSYNDATVMLQMPSGFGAFVAALKANPGLRVQAEREREVVARTMNGFDGILQFASYFVGAIMAVGATLGAINSLYALVDTRRRDIATLRAIGFGPGPVVTAVLAESILLAILGALVGTALAWTFFNGLSASPFGISFQLAVTPLVFAVGAGWALLMGLIGGLLPALRTARVPVSLAFRAS
ncbi:MAG: FtsX-like permease family protein [Steroidobacteraceae bacterium]